jgi:hypothetical protein
MSANVSKNISEDRMSQKIENAALLNEIINVEELEQKIAPSGQLTWDD